MRRRRQTIVWSASRPPQRAGPGLGGKTIRQKLALVLVRQQAPPKPCIALEVALALVTWQLIFQGPPARNHVSVESNTAPMPVRGMTIVGEAPGDRLGEVLSAHLSNYICDVCSMHSSPRCSRERPEDGPDRGGDTSLSSNRPSAADEPHGVLDEPAQGRLWVGHGDFTNYAYAKNGYRTGCLKIVWGWFLRLGVLIF